MKLISMTDFVLNQKQSESFNEKTFINEALISLENIRNYAKFLKQPLKLEMFFPCDNDDEILKPQYIAGKEEIYNEFVHEASMDKVKEYNDAKEKVLFEGFYIKRGSSNTDNMTTYLMHNYFGEIAFKKDWKDEWEFIEDLESLSNFGELELTESAVKQIGL